MESNNQNPNKKRNIFFVIAGLFIVILGYIFWNRSKNKVSENATAASDSTDTEKKTDNSTNTGSGTLSPVATTIGINNPRLTVSPFIGQFHLTAVIGIVSPPISGTLQIFIGSEEIQSVALPISGNSYVLDEYVVINDPENPQNLLAKIGSVSKTVQVQV